MNGFIVAIIKSMVNFEFDRPKTCHIQAHTKFHELISITEDNVKIVIIINKQITKEQNR